MNPLVNWIKSLFSGVVWTKPSYVVTQVSPGHYDIAITLSALGTQHLALVFDATSDTFSLSGKVSVIGPDAGLPFSYFSDMINQAFVNFISSTVVANKVAEHRAKLMKQHKYHH